MLVKCRVFPVSVIVVAKLVSLVMNYMNFYHLKKQRAVFGNILVFPPRTERDRRKKNEVSCKLCPKKMNYQGNTTNMMVHLQYNHRSEYLKAKEKTKTKRMQPPRTTTSSCSDRQPSITEAFHQMEPLSQSSKRWKQLNNSASRRICYQ